MTEYQQPPGVEYQPGVNAHGETVVPADLNGGYNLKLPETIVIPIELFLQDKYHIPANSVLWAARPRSAPSRSMATGSISTARRLSDPEQAALADLCRQQVPYK
jgi:hypothetical protein